MNFLRFDACLRACAYTFLVTQFGSVSLWIIITVRCGVSAIYFNINNGRFEFVAVKVLSSSWNILLIHITIMFTGRRFTPECTYIYAWRPSLFVYSSSNTRTFTRIRRYDRNQTLKCRRWSDKTGYGGIGAVLLKITDLNIMATDRETDWRGKKEKTSPRQTSSTSVSNAFLAASMSSRDLNRPRRPAACEKLSNVVFYRDARRRVINRNSLSYITSILEPFTFSQANPTILIFRVLNTRVRPHARSLHLW